jgi:glutamate synthase domain-containing protein 1/glutamate synthase domain-containing protein 3
MASTEQIGGRHLLQALDQMRNRGNGKGGGIAAVGLQAEQLGVTQDILETSYLLVIAYLDVDSRDEVERSHIQNTFEVKHVEHVSHLEDFRELPELDVQPPEVFLYFVQVREQSYEAFRSKYDLKMKRRAIEDEIVYQNTVRLNERFYASTGQKRAFVLSHGKNLLVIKMVGYGDDVIRYYQLEELRAHVWIGHHRYPTKGRVWHPGGAHPFVGLNEALVHNGDFANYASICEYLAQRNIHPQFLTDTEVAAQVFDLLYRTYDYPLEYVIEALAPTTESDFMMLPAAKRSIYEMLQVTHMHCSPDGPWFFLIAQSDREDDLPAYRLTGITDTSMLRPQVFAWQQASPEGPAVGLAASEKQAIDAALASLSAKDKRFWSRADRYWNARGGSHTDGGAFVFTAYPNGTGSARLVCTDKFGRELKIDTTRPPYRSNGYLPLSMPLPDLGAAELFDWVRESLPAWSYEDVLDFLSSLASAANSEEGFTRASGVLTLLMDRRYPTGEMRRSNLLSLYDECFAKTLSAFADMKSDNYIFFCGEGDLQADGQECQTAVIDARRYAPQGPDSLSAEIVRLYKRGFRKYIIVHARGQRFIGNGLGPEANGVSIDVYGTPGDYLASGIDGCDIRVHGSAQDQLAQIMKDGKLVVYGDVGQTFMYGAKGGEAYILGNAAGRPLINAVGKPRVIINGTCLDYLAESFMAGDPLAGGGFVVLNGLRATENGDFVELERPYPGGNLFSLASGGALYVRDPRGLVGIELLNGGVFQPFEERDWEVIGPYLDENSRLFGIAKEQLLTVDGQQLRPELVYRKIRPAAVRALQAEETWVETLTR